MDEIYKLQTGFYKDVDPSEIYRQVKRNISNHSLLRSDTSCVQNVHPVTKVPLEEDLVYVDPVTGVKKTIPAEQVMKPCPSCQPAIFYKSITFAHDRECLGGAKCLRTEENKLNSKVKCNCAASKYMGGAFGGQFPFITCESMKGRFKRDPKNPERPCMVCGLYDHESVSKDMLHPRCMGLSR